MDGLQAGGIINTMFGNDKKTFELGNIFFVKGNTVLVQHIFYISMIRYEIDII